LQQPPIRWALGQLQNALHARGLIADIQYNLERIYEPGERVLVTPGESRLAGWIAVRMGVKRSRITTVYQKDTEISAIYPKVFCRSA